MNQQAEDRTNNENGFYYPSPEITLSANVQEYEQLYRRSIEDPQGFWAERAAELEWSKPWEKVLDDSNPPFYKWFVGGKTNIVYNALDRHLKTYRKNKLALIWEGEPGDTRTFSYFALHREVCKFANVLRSMGVKKGDVVTIYLPRIPEQVIAMLACAKIGAPHSVVYGGFSVESLAERIEDANSRLLITADGGWMRGKVVGLKEIADEAISRQASIEVLYRGQAHRAGDLHGSRARLLVSRPDEPAYRQLCLLYRAAGRRRPVIHSLYIRHHRAA